MHREFIKLCIEGKLEEAKTLYLLNNEWFLFSWKIDVYDIIKEAFVISCYYNQLKVAQWLYSLDCCNIHMNIDKIFELSCKNYNLDIIKWLLQIDIFDDKILDKHLPKELYEYALQLGYVGDRNMVKAYNKFKPKMLKRIKKNLIKLLEINDLVGIIMEYV